MKLYLGVALLIFGVDTACRAETELFTIKEIGNAKGSFLAIETASGVTIVPQTLSVRSSETQRGLSAIIQRGDAFGADIPYFANFTINYTFITEPEALQAALKASKIKQASTNLVQSMRYSSMVAVWSSTEEKYSVKPLDSGSTSFASNLVGTFSLEFKNADEVSGFFKHPHPLILITEVNPDINIVITRDNSELNALIDSIFNDKKPSTRLPLTELYLKIVARYGKTIPGDETYITNFLTEWASNLKQCRNNELYHYQTERYRPLI
jgi:hypothetical protein